MSKDSKNKNYVGYVEPHVSFKVKFSLSELEQMKQFATEKGNVYIKVNLTKNKEQNNKGNAWALIEDPASWESSKPAETSADGMPF